MELRVLTMSPHDVVDGSSATPNWRRRGARMARSKLLPLCATTVAAVSCKSGTGRPPHRVPQLFNDVRPNGLVAAAEAIASVEPAGESAITVTVQFQNDSALPVELRLLGGNCLIRFIAYADPNLRGVWSWNGILDEP